MEAEEAFGVVLRKLRTGQGLSQEQLAFDSGLNRQFVSLLELGERAPGLETLYKLAAGLKLNGSDLLIQLEAHMRAESKSKRRR